VSHFVCVRAQNAPRHTTQKPRPPKPLPPPPTNLALQKTLYSIPFNKKHPPIHKTENCYFIQRWEPGYEGRAIADIARELFSYADGATMSAKKEALSNAGGLLCLNDDALFEKVSARVHACARVFKRGQRTKTHSNTPEPFLTDHKHTATKQQTKYKVRNLTIVIEGFPTYGGLACRDLMAMAHGLREATDGRYQAYRHGCVFTVRTTWGSMLCCVGLLVRWQARLQPALIARANKQPPKTNNQKPTGRSSCWPACCARAACPSSSRPAATPSTLTRRASCRASPATSSRRRSGGVLGGGCGVVLLSGVFVLCRVWVWLQQAPLKPNP
jgi:hypothetical protein